MKFSLCSTYAKQKPVEEVIAVAGALGLDGIEIWDEHIDGYLRRNGGDMNTLKTLLDANRLQCCCVSPYMDLIDGTKTLSSLTLAEKCCQYANALGAKCVRMILGSKPSALLTLEERERCTQNLRRVNTIAAQYGVCFAIETHMKHPSDNAKSVLSFIEQCGGGYIKVLFDGFNFLPENLDILQEYMILKDYVVHFHIKNYLNFSKKRIPVPLGDGDADLAPLVAAAKDKDAFWSFEYFNCEVEPLIPSSIAWMKKVANL